MGAFAFGAVEPGGQRTAKAPELEVIADDASKYSGRVISEGRLGDVLVLLRNRLHN